jgi:hypothetical protein
MELSDKKIKDILGSDNEPITAPNWEAFAGSVKRQNFMQFGLRHVNIYSTSILAVICCGLAFFVFTYFNPTTQSVGNKKQMIEKTIQKPSVDLTNTVNEAKEATVSDATNSAEIMSIEKEVKQQKKVANEQPEVQTRLEKNIEPEATAEIIPEVSEETITENFETPKIPKQTYKGKTVIVYETDTVIEIDTIVIDKKFKKR